MKTRSRFLWGVLILAALAASCATTGGQAGVPPEVKVSVINFAPSTEIGLTTEVNFSVVNLTDRELTGLTLVVTANPSNGVDLPYEEKAIDRIAPGGSWNPGPFVVRGRHTGSTAVFFTVMRDGVRLARDYTLVQVGADDRGFIFVPF
jgi:hypothetical protein